MDLSRIIVVIVFHNYPEDTIECVKSVLNSDISCQVVLIDNGSSEPSYKTVTEALPGISVIRLPENLGFVGGYNAGINYALKFGATDILILNNDTVVESSTIRYLYQAEWDICVPKVLFYDQPTIIQSAGSRWRSFPPSIIMIGFKAKDNPSYNSPGPLKYAIGCALLVRRSVFEEVGGFDLEFQNYFEDYDFFYRVGVAGFQSGYVPSARIYHKASLTTSKIPHKRRWFLGRNTVLFYRKDNRFSTWQLWTFMIWFLLRETLKGNLSHLRDYLDGFRDGFKYLRDNSRG